jgi:3-methyladenine DNA glycosylase AlkD
MLANCGSHKGVTRKAKKNIEVARPGNIPCGVAMRKIIDEIELHGSAARSESAKIFLQICPGGYGFGDRVCGADAPTLRKIAATYANISLSESEELLQNDLHDARFVALVILSGKFQRDGEGVFGVYIKNTKFINNWDLVDVSAHKICGAHCLQIGDATAIWQLANSDDLWENRIAVVSTLAFIRAGELQLTLNVCEHLLNHRHHLIHKACGWMLRELGKRDKNALIDFVNSHKLPGIMKSYALEIVKKNDQK